MPRALMTCYGGGWPAPLRWRPRYQHRTYPGIPRPRRAEKAVRRGCHYGMAGATYPMGGDRWRNVPLIGCGAVKFHRAGPAVIKRMRVAPAMRGTGLGRRILSELEGHAAASGARAVRLETSRTLREAIRRYRAADYREVAAFTDEPYAPHLFEKVLPGP